MCHYPSWYVPSILVQTMSGTFLPRTMSGTFLPHKMSGICFQHTMSTNWNQSVFSMFYKKNYSHSCKMGRPLRRVEHVSDIHFGLIPSAQVYTRFPNLSFIPCINHVLYELKNRGNKNKAHKQAKKLFDQLSTRSKST